jgi:hypothetical protein
MVDEFNTSLSPRDRSYRQKKINRETLQLIDAIHQIDLMHIYRIFHSTAAEHTFLAVHESFSKIDNILG